MQIELNVTQATLIRDRARREVNHYDRLLKHNRGDLQLHRMRSEWNEIFAECDLALARAK